MRLCKDITTESEIAKVAEKAASFKKQGAMEFLDDVGLIPDKDHKNPENHIFNNVKNLGGDLLDGWKLLYDAKALTIRREFDQIEYSSQILSKKPASIMPDQIARAIENHDSKRSFIEGLCATTNNDKFLEYFSGAITYANPVKYGSIITEDLTQNVILQAIETARKSAQVEKDIQAISQQSELAGETAADIYYTGNGYVSLHCALPGGGKQGQFDRVFAKKDAQGNVSEVIVVECKGGASPLGGRVDANKNRNQQGSSAYLDDIILNMENVVRNNPSLLNLYNTSSELRKHFRNQTIKYCLLRQPFDDNGNLKKITITKFIL